MPAFLSVRTHSVSASAFYLFRFGLGSSEQNPQGWQTVNVPFVVRLDSQKVNPSFSKNYSYAHLLLLFQHIDFSLTSPYGGGRWGRVKRKRAKAAAAQDASGDEDGDKEWMVYDTHRVSPFIGPSDEETPRTTRPRGETHDFGIFLAHR